MRTEKLRLPKGFYARPLTPKESDFAADNFGIIRWYLNKECLPWEDWFDVVISSYLLSVKRWFAVPNLQQYSFVTIACRAMKSAVGNEKRKQAKQPQIVSLYEPILGTDGLCFIDVIPANGFN